MKTSPLGELASGSVRCLFSTDVSATVAALHAAIPGVSENVRLVTDDCSELPPIEKLLERFVRSLAEAAGWLWPDWYDGAVCFDRAANSFEQRLADRLITRRLARTQRRIHPAWLKAAVAACREGRVPFLPQFPLAVQVQQLSLLLSEADLVIAVSLRVPNPSAERLMGFTRGLEWLAREADACVLAVLPVELKEHPELERIGFGALNCEPFAELQGYETENDLQTFEPPILRIGPIIGRPHPGSPGEQLLAEHLARDAELGPLFGFNRWVATVFDSRHLVDLLWDEGRVVVEVDGYGFHSTPTAFASDRHRDYELTLSGYLVLRLPHDFVVHDPQLAVERIREFVEFRTKHPFVKSEATHYEL